MSIKFSYFSIFHSDMQSVMVINPCRTFEMTTFTMVIQIAIIMNSGRYVFSQITDFLPKRKFERLVTTHLDQTNKWSLTYWSHFLVLMFGQLFGCESLRELSDIVGAHAKKSFHLGFGQIAPNRSTISKANSLRRPEVFERFALYMIAQAQQKRIDTQFSLNGKFYAIDSTTIDLCMSLFDWAKFRSTKSGIKVHTQIDVVTQIPSFYDITNANVHDVNFLDKVNYEPLAAYILDRGYWDLNRLFRVEQAMAFFIIREKRRPKFEVTSGADLLEDGNILRDQTIRFTTNPNKVNYPSEIRRIVAYIPDLGHTFTFYTNNFYLAAENIVFLYKNRWIVDLFFKWIKQHLKVKRFWGDSETAVRIQINVAIATYCLVAIIEKELGLNRNIYEVMRILGSSLLTKDSIKELLTRQDEPEPEPNRQLEFYFET